MIRRVLAPCRSSLGAPLTRLALVAAAAGVLTFLAALPVGHARTALAALAASWLFFAGLAAGSVALSAAVRLSGGEWARPLLPVADAGAGFFGPALALLAVLVLGAPAFVPWARHLEPAALVPFAFRELAATAILFAVGFGFTERAARAAGGVGRFSVAYLLLYAAVLSMWAYDLVLGLTDAPPSTVVPAYYFLGAFFSAAAWLALVLAVRGASSADLRHDVGKLVFALILLWSYMLWAVFLPTWYANVPEEAAPLLARWRGPYQVLTIAVLVAVFAWPFWLLFPEGLKRRRSTLAVGSALVLGGMLGERFLLVLPSLQLPGGAGALAVGAGVTVGVLGVFLLAFGRRLGAAPGATQ